MATLILIFLSFAVYVNSLSNWFVSDDVAGILQNPAVGDFSHVLQSGLGFFELGAGNIFILACCFLAWP
ncbi:hypothetical protein HY085_02955 [Candidatus Gottesmanbacteria bacterium]|nr:hypothetical protein [Candidatus Gottesmanbacteria bacterium]